MSAKACTPAAANDARFRKPVISSAKNVPAVASSQFPPVQVVHCCKPACHVKRSSLALPYPSNPEFTKRISQEAWRQLNADLLEAIYAETPYCLWWWKDCRALHTFNLPNHRALYKVVAYYNRHLFHPMLIDAQIFADHDTVGIKRWSPLEHQYFVGFLIAHTSDELQAFPRPEPGVSSGYIQLYLPWGCKALSCGPDFPDFHIESPNEIPEAVPDSCPMPPAMYAHTAEFLAREPEALVGCDCYAWSAAHPSDRLRPPAPKAATHTHVYKIPRQGATNAGYTPVPVKSMTPVLVPVAAAAGRAAHSDPADLLPSKDATYEMVATPAQQMMVREYEEG